MPTIPVPDLILDLAIRYGFQVAGAVVILVVGVLVARWTGRVTADWLERRGTEPPIRTLAARGVRILVVAFALVLALDKFGFQIAPLVAGIGVAGVGIGFALQGVLSNLMAGLSIILTKPFRVGEHIELLGVHGDVLQIELFSTTLVHPDRSRVVIPNRKIVGEILHNFGTMRQLHLTVSVGHRSDFREILAVARDTVTAHPGVLAEPAPQVGVAAVSDVAVTVSVEPWVMVRDYAAVRGELYQALVERLRTRTVEMPPTRELRVVAGP
jgi:small conductance mechanosensitive channel